MRLFDMDVLRPDGNLDYICAMFDENYKVIGTGSCFGNTLRCFAVSSAHQGEGLLNQIMCQQLSKAGIDCIVVSRKAGNVVHY